jgi:hypothetical protein
LDLGGKKRKEKKLIVWIDALTNTNAVARIKKKSDNCSVELNIKLPPKKYNPEVLSRQKQRSILFHIYHHVYNDCITFIPHEFNTCNKSLRRIRREKAQHFCPTNYSK